MAVAQSSNGRGWGGVVVVVVVIVVVAAVFVALFAVVDFYPYYVV